MFEEFFNKKMYLQKTPLCDIMTFFGSDKATSEKSSHHNYTTFYHYLFQDKINIFLNVFELGLGSNNHNIPSNMSGLGSPGGSLRAWKTFFSNANIYGADIDKDILFQEDRIKTYYCNQLSSNSISSLWKNFNFKFDLILEDGLHTYAANKTFLQNSIHMVSDGGFYIIEDIVNDRIPLYKDLVHYVLQNNFKYAEIIKIPNDNNFSDNTIFVAKK